MGKSPKTWLKTLLHRKKPSKPDYSKVRETENEKEVLVSSRTLEADDGLEPPHTSVPTSCSVNRDERKTELVETKDANITEANGVSLTPSQEREHSSSNSICDIDKEKQENAATIAQAAFRGYLARRAFRALKGIIRLQALIRGHLVRRQAIATLCCVMGIVKVQAQIRGRIVRHSDVGLEVQKKCSIANFLLLAPSPSVIPLHLHYDSEESNSVWSWSDRWSISCFWKPLPQRKRASRTHRKQVTGQAAQVEPGRPKRSVRRLQAASVDHVSVQPLSEVEKSKRPSRKVSAHPTDSVPENPQSELEKVKRNLRKGHTPATDNIVQSEFDSDKSKENSEKITSPLNPDIEQETINVGSDKNLEIAETVNMSCDVKPFIEPPEAGSAPGEPTSKAEKNYTSEMLGVDSDSVEPKLLSEISDTDGNALISKEELNDYTDNQNQKSGRKSSNPSKQERADYGPQSSPKVPSYMAATASAKAKLRLQGSPGFGEGVADKNSATRRHSLASSNNSRVTSQSPRTQREVHSGGKGVNKGDKSMLSSKDGNAKVQVEWRR